MNSLLRSLSITVLLVFAVETVDAQWSVYQNGDVRGSGMLLVVGDHGIVQGHGPNMHVTSDDGATWSPVSPPWGGGTVSGMLKFGDRFYMHSSHGTNGFVRTTTDIQNWEIVPGLVKSVNGDSHGLATLLTDGKVIWIRTFVNTTDNPNGEIYTSEDGENWTFVAAADGFSHYFFHGDKLYARQGTTALMATSDYGKTWEEVAPLNIGSIKSGFVSAGDRIYVHVEAATQEQLLLVSSDDGASWSQVRSFAAYNIQPRVFSDDNLAVFWVAGGKQQISITTDHGQSWLDSNGPIPASGYVFDGHLYLSDGFSKKSVRRAPLGALGVSVEGTPRLHSMEALRPAYPNPFVSSTEIKYDLPQSGPVDLRVYDMLGREVIVLLRGDQPPGEGRVKFEAGDLPSGLYLVRLTAGGRSETQGALLVRD